MTGSTHRETACKMFFFNCLDFVIQSQSEYNDDRNQQTREWHAPMDPHCFDEEDWLVEFAQRNPGGPDPWINPSCTAASPERHT